MNILKQTKIGNGIKLIEEENILAVVSEKPLTTIGSAIHNGGYTKTKVIVNTQVTDEYGNINLHNDPESFIINNYKKLGLDEEFVGMITYAIVKEHELFAKKDKEAAVTVIATAGCTHAESAGEKIEFKPIEGTINIIVIIEGNPTDSCLASTIITATEAKTAALRELDLRSKWSGDEATGTITDAIVVAKTAKGPTIVYGGPASPLGQMIGCCTRKAVKEAVTKAKVGGFPPNRPIINRLQERQLPITKISTELAKIKSLNMNQKTLAERLTELLKDPAKAAIVLAASKLDEDIQKGLIPSQFKDIEQASSAFAESIGKTCENKERLTAKTIIVETEQVDLPPFLKKTLLNFL